MERNEKRYLEKLISNYQDKETSKVDELKALVKKVIDSLGGNISIQSELGVGTTFVVELKEN